jgi:hypothetical protein
MMLAFAPTQVEVKVQVKKKSSLTLA